MTSYDIKITTEDTLELDAIIRAWNAKSNSMVDVKDGTEGTDFNLGGIQTNTAIFDPIKSGTYNIDVNGQKLTVKVEEASTIPDSVVDNFDTALYDDQNNTLSDYYTGDVNSFARATTTAYDGNYSLQGDGGTGSGIEISSDSGLPNYPQQGDTFEYYTYAGGTNQLIYFEFANKNYAIHSGVRDGTLELILDGTEEDQASTSLSKSTWYRHRVEWGSNGSISVTVYDPNDNIEGQVSGTDATYTGGGITYNYRKGKTFLDGIYVT